MNILKKIIAYKQEEVEAQSKIIPLDRLQKSQRLFAVRDFKKALEGEDIQIIAEIKRQSPSEKNIYPNANPAEVAKSYQLNGAAALSVLTDSHFFGGHLDFVQQVKTVVDLPILRKDFIISNYQVWESFHAGADAILLIADAIDFSLLTALYNLASDLGMHVLIETHSLEHLDNIASLNPQIVGINCRNLQTMETDLSWFKSVYSKLPSDCVKVAESGIKTNTALYPR
jgi:indole-3-glycerol phosphate synthase